MPAATNAVVWVADDQVFTGVDYGTRLLERLAARGLTVRREDLTRTDGRVPAADLHVISGGGTSVSDHSGWMPAGLNLVRRLVEGAEQGRHSTFGVCLGSQMIAEVLWPGAIRSADRIEVGLREVTWQLEQPSAATVVIPVFHYEEVRRDSAVKGGAEVIAERADGGLQGFRYRDRIWGVQFHPELAPIDVRNLIKHHRHVIETHRSTVAAAMASVSALEAAWSPGTFDQIVDRVATGGR